MLSVAKADVVLQSGPRKAARKEMDAKTEEITELQGRLVAKSANLSQFSVQRGEAIDELNCVKLQNMAGTTVSNDFKSVARARECPAKRAKMTRPCKEYFYYASGNGIFGSAD